MKRTEKNIHHWDQLRRKGETNDSNWQNIWEASDNYGRDFEPDVEAGLRKLKHRMAQEPTGAKQITLSRGRWLRAVAAAGALALLAWAGFAKMQSPTVVANWVEVQTNANEKLEVVLPDGSAINLNGNSYLAYRSDLNEAETRQVKLKGEAFFDVNRRPEQAFIIATPQAEITVLGTSFNVRSFPAEKSTEVEVSTGRVAVRSLQLDQEVVLEANEMVILNENQQPAEQAAPFLNRQAWRTGKITFRETPAAEALLLLERFYGVSFILKDNSANCKITTGNLQNAPLEVALETIEEVTSLQISKLTGNTFEVIGDCK